jgi:hypothetical protein
MTDTSCCPHCGTPRVVPHPRDAAGTDGPGGQPGLYALDSLYREVKRIREIAEERVAAGGRRGAEAAAGDSEQRIAELTREVLELRATVARLRGSSAVELVRSA